MSRVQAEVNSDSFAKLEQKALQALVAAIRSSVSLPRGHDYDYHTTDPAFRARIKKAGERLLKLVSRVADRELHRSTTSEGKASDKASESVLSSVIDEDDRAQIVSDAADVLLERVDISFDEIRGLRKAASSLTDVEASQATVSLGAWNKPGASAAAAGRSGKSFVLMHAKNIQRPQLMFPDPIDNFSLHPFKPKLTKKPNAKVPLKLQPINPASLTAGGDEVHPALASHVASLRLGGAAASPARQAALAKPYYEHPYQTELATFEAQPWQLETQTPQEPRPLNDTPLTWIDKEEDVEWLANLLKRQTEFAIDLEAHSYRSYYGFCCLMQISTREEDFVVDTLALRGKLEPLNESFTDPNILKVMHGADSDIIWLQRDLGLYIVNMFDTGQAMRVLNFPRYSLAYLLKHFCDVSPNKSYQLADWRIRPIPSEMLSYAREDTHYLLFVYDKLRNELLSSGNESANLLRAVYSRSRDVCLQRFEMTTYDPESAEVLYQKQSRQLNQDGLEIFKALHAWRDQAAREEDESPRYILQDHMLLELADKAPAEPSQVLGCCQPVPPLVRVHAHIITEIIQQAKANGADGVDLIKNTSRWRQPRDVSGADEPTESTAPADDASEEGDQPMETDQDGVTHAMAPKLAWDDDDTPAYEPKNPPSLADIQASGDEVSDVAKAMASTTSSTVEDDQALASVLESFSGSLLSFSNAAIVSNLRQLAKMDEEKERAEADRKKQKALQREQIKINLDGESNHEALTDETKQDILRLSVLRAKEAEEFEQEEQMKTAEVAVSANGAEATEKSLHEQRSVGLLEGSKQLKRKKSAKNKDTKRQKKDKANVKASEVTPFDYKGQTNKAALFGDDGGSSYRGGKFKSKKAQNKGGGDLQKQQPLSKGGKKKNKNKDHGSSIKKRTAVASGNRSSTVTFKKKRK